MSQIVSGVSPTSGYTARIQTIPHLDQNIQIQSIFLLFRQVQRDFLFSNALSLWRRLCSLLCLYQILNIFCSVLTQIFSWGSKLWWSTNNNPDKNWSKKIELYMQDNGWGITWGFCHWSRGVSVVRCVATCLQIKFGFWHFSSSFIIRQSWTNLSNLSQYLVRIF